MINSFEQQWMILYIYDNHCCFHEKNLSRNIFRFNKKYNATPYLSDSIPKLWAKNTTIIKNIIYLKFVV